MCRKVVIFLLELEFVLGVLLLNVQVVPVDISKNVYIHLLLHSFEQQQWPQMELELMANTVIWHPNTPNTFLP